MKIKKLMSVNVHSLIDIITNSSSEIFCTVKGKTEKQIEKVLDSVLKDFGCEGVEFFVREKEDDDGNEIPGVFNVLYDYETGHIPCKMMTDKIAKLLNAEIYEE